MARSDFKTSSCCGWLRSPPAASETEKRPQRTASTPPGVFPSHSLQDDELAQPRHRGGFEMTSKQIAIFGATSAIAMETARLYAREGAVFFLAARNKAKLETVKKDLLTRGAAGVEYTVADLSNTDKHALLLAEAGEKLPECNTVLIAYGSLGDQAECQKDYKAAEKELQINFLSAVSLLTYIANHFERKGEGTIAVISSVAGDRGRQSNYIYGSAKGALNLFLAGLRNRLAATGVTVITIKPGFVDTPMTAHIKKGLLFVSPKTVAKGIYRAIAKKKDVVYLPWFWRWIMLIINHVPERVFKKLKL